MSIVLTVVFYLRGQKSFRGCPQLQPLFLFCNDVFKTDLPSTFFCAIFFTSLILRPSERSFCDSALLLSNLFCISVGFVTVCGNLGGGVVASDWWLWKKNLLVGFEENILR